MNGCAPTNPGAVSVPVGPSDDSVAAKQRKISPSCQTSSQNMSHEDNGQQRHADGQTDVGKTDASEPTGAKGTVGTDPQGLNGQNLMGPCPAYKFCYFPFRGRGEFIRYIFHYLDIPFIDNRVTFEQWAQVKPRTPFGSLPVLHVDDDKITQSFAIARYLANTYGLAGSSTWDQACIDMYADGISDVMSAFRGVCCAVIAQENSQVPQLFSKYREETVLPFLDKYEAFLKENSTGWLVGNKISWADILLAELLERLQSCFDPTILTGHPRANALMERVHTIPNIARYIEKRPKMPF